MDIKKGGNVLILGGAGPMGLGAIEYPLVGGNRPARVVVADIDDKRLANAAKFISPERAKQCGVELIYINPKSSGDQYAALLDITKGAGYDDVFIYAPVRELAELGDRLMAFDGCLNFFAGPQDKNFSAMMNLYNCHYTSTHILGSTGGNTDDLKEALLLSSQQKLRPAVMVSHICGIDAVAEATAHLPELRAGKILSYTHIDLPLTALSDFSKLGKENPLFAQLADYCEKHDGVWNDEAEKTLLDHFNVKRG
jgi:threonine dehydrogenase-like Zn-dependent dehydrogenase